MDHLQSSLSGVNTSSASFSLTRQNIYKFNSEKGGSWDKSWTEPRLNEAGTSLHHGGRHIIGINGANEFGETMSSVFYFDNGAKDQENYQIKYEWVKGLPTICGTYRKDSFGRYT